MKSRKGIKKPRVSMLSKTENMIKKYNLEELGNLSIEDFSRFTSNNWYNGYDYAIELRVRTEKVPYKEKDQIFHDVLIDNDIYEWFTVPKEEYENKVKYNPNTSKAKKWKAKVYYPLLEEKEFIEKELAHKPAIGLYKKQIKLYGQLAELSSIYVDWIRELYQAHKLEFLVDKILLFQEMEQEFKDYEWVLTNGLESFEDKLKHEKTNNKIKALEQKRDALDAQIKELKSK